MSRATFYVVKSETKKGKKYTVRLMPHGEWYCSCPHNVFTRKQCKHIEYAQNIRRKCNESKQS